MPAAGVGKLHQRARNVSAVCGRYVRLGRSERTAPICLPAFFQQQHSSHRLPDCREDAYTR